MKVQKAYIIRIADPISQEYATIAAASCERVGIKYEFFQGIENKSSYDAWLSSGVDIKEGSNDHRKNDHHTNAASCASASHAKLWKLIYERKECAIILEHDAIMLHPVTIDIPDNMIVTLGFKVKNPENYDHMSAGPSITIWERNMHQGAHAYAITHHTAKLLLDELKEIGVQGAIDNIYFMKNRKTKVPLGLADPISALGWIRKSTIWDESADFNYAFTKSFYKYYKE